MRTKRKLTLKQLAEKVGVTFGYICNVEKGRRAPSIEMLGRYARAFEEDIVVTIKCKK